MAAVRREMATGRAAAFIDLLNMRLSLFSVEARAFAPV